MLTTRMGSFALVLIVALSAPTLAQQMMRVHVDATDLPRKLLRSTLEFDAMGDTVALLYPEWIPGIHSRAQGDRCRTWPASCPAMPTARCCAGSGTGRTCIVCWYCATRASGRS